MSVIKTHVERKVIRNILQKERFRPRTVIIIFLCRSVRHPEKVAGEYCPADQVVTKTYIVGAEKGSADYQYCATEKFLNGTCNIHDAETQDEEKPEEEPADPPDDAKPEETHEPEQIPEKNEE